MGKGHTTTEGSTVKSSPATTPDPARAQGGLQGKRLSLVFGTLLLAMAVSSLSETIAATALPTIVGDLGGVEAMQWVTTTYILATTVTMPIYGKLGDVVGRKRLLMGCLALYAAGKAVCGLTPNMGFLIVGRLVSGLGGGGLIILSQASLADIIPPRRLGTFMGVMGSTFTACRVVGPLLGGWFVEVTGWRWIFWFTVPLALAALAGLWRFLPRDAADRKTHPDYAGMVSLAAAVCSLVLALSWGGNRFAWDSWQVVGLLCVAVASAGCLVAAERRAASPVMPLGLFRDRNFVLTSAVGFLINIGLMGAVSYLPTYFQIVDRMSPEAAGLMCVPMSVGSLVASTSTGMLASKTGRYRWMPVAMCAVCAAGFGLMATMAPGTPVWQTVAILLTVGCGFGLGLQILTLIVQNEFPHSMVGTATAANSLFRQVGSTVGASLVGSLFTARLVADVADRLPPADNVSLPSITPSFVDGLSGPVQAAVAQGYSEALVPLFAYFVPLCLAGLVLALFIRQKPLATTIDHGAAGK